VKTNPDLAAMVNVDMCDQSKHSQEVSTMKRLGLRPVVALAVLAISALGLVPSASASSTAPARASATTIKVSAGEFFFKLSAKSIAKPGSVTFTVKNVGTIEHDFKINGKKTPLFGPGKTVKLTVSFKKKGSYPYLCTVPGHAAAGMKGTFTVK
jgi:uncharacterized cupredoxin-like copper-binding protein